MIHYFLLQAVPDLIRKFIEVMITQGRDGHEVEISGIPGASSAPTDGPIPRRKELTGNRPGEECNQCPVPLVH